MKGDRVFAIVVGILMLSSVAGFALMNVYEAPQKVQIPSIVERVMDPSERVQVLQTGRVLIEYLYEEDCATCGEKSAFYQSFVNNFKNYAVLEVAEVPANITADRLIGANGETIQLQGINTTEEMLNAFCSVAIVKPQECLLMEI